MTPAQAATEYLRLEASDYPAAIDFAHRFEDTATEEAFDEYLDAIEASYS